MRINKMNIPSVLSSIALLSVLAGCSSLNTGDNVDPSAFDDVNIELESIDIDEGFVRVGQYMSGESLSVVGTEITREEVQSSLGSPLPSSGDEWWFYNVNLPLSGDIDDYLVCQYRVGFDGSGTVNGVDWRRPQCSVLYADLLARMEPEPVVLSSDVLFAFDSSIITPAGAQELDKAAGVIKQELNLQRMTIVGHTDRIGSEEYNQKLSEQRAEAVGKYLVSAGVSANVVMIQGRGSSEPVVFCEGERVTEALKACLQDNRRVEITIEGLL